MDVPEARGPREAVMAGQATNRIRKLAARELITGRVLAAALRAPAPRLDLATRLFEAGVLREMTGWAVWRAFAVS